MPEHIKVEFDLKPIEEGLPEDNKIYWIRRKDKGCLRQAGYIGGSQKQDAGWYLFPNGTLPLNDVTHYGRPPEMGQTPCEEQREVMRKFMRTN